MQQQKLSLSFLKGFWQLRLSNPEQFFLQVTMKRAHTVSYKTEKLEHQRFSEDRQSSTSEIPSTSIASEDLTIQIEINIQRKRNKHMHIHFHGLIPNTEICIADFCCAQNKDFLIRHGRLYISQEYVGFHSPIGNTVTCFHVSKIKEIIPKTTLMLPTAIDVVLTDDKIIHLMSFAYRQNALSSLHRIIQRYKSRSSLETNSNTTLSFPKQTLVLDSDKRNSSILFLPGTAICTILLFMNLVMLMQSVRLSSKMY
jgi:hypothetical protein